MRTTSVFWTFVWALLCVGVLACGVGPVPRAQFPSARSALERLHAQQSCSVGIRAEAILDTLDSTGRVRVKTLMLTQFPASIRFDVISPFGSPLATLTSDGQRFTLLDVENNVFVSGPARQCAVSEFLKVPIPPKVLAQLLSGDAPVLRHGARGATLRWQDGAYEIEISGAHQATQVLRITVHPDDYNKPVAQQRLRLSRVAVAQAGVELYRATLSEHRARKRSAAWQDPEGIEPNVPPSGPPCNVELAADVEFVVQVAERDVILNFSSVEHNPPLLEHIFTQPNPPGARHQTLSCE